ncbi:hypothetical protein [Marilutibacter alkalisoli]|nr:hypothetical protein [Lysobacter alkalisoli]
MTALDALRIFIEDHEQPFVIAGAGVNTDSGTPDHRDRNSGWERAQAA